MLQWMRKRAEERKAKHEEERQRKEQLLKYKKNILDILHSGKLPGGMNFIVNGGKPPFILQRSEHLLWVFSSVEYLEQKARREDDEVFHRGIGLLAVTTKHIYFNGDRRSLRLPFGKIVSVEQGIDGIAITIGLAGIPSSSLSVAKTPNSHTT